MVTWEKIVCALCAVLVTIGSAFVTYVLNDLKEDIGGLTVSVKELSDKQVEYGNVITRMLTLMEKEGE